MAVVFLEGSLPPIPTQKWRAPNSIVDPIAGYVNLHCRVKNWQIIKRNLLLDLDFLYHVRSFS